MALYKFSDERLEAVSTKTFTALGLRERQDIQRMIKTHIEAITPNARTMVLAEEFCNWADSNRRIDLLCLDDQANLIVVELKRDDSAFMDLQALRYASMISAMRFDQAVEAHRKYLGDKNTDLDAEERIRLFLDKDPDEPVSLSDKVRVVLAASDFSVELTTAVLWLNKQGLDIRCVQIRPHELVPHVLWDINQIIPLPQEEQYQVALREKLQEQDSVRRRGSHPKFDLYIGDDITIGLSKRKLVLMVAKEAFRQGMTTAQIQDAVGKSFAEIPSDGAEPSVQTRLRNFTLPDQQFLVNGRTFVFSNQWGEDALAAVKNLTAQMPEGQRVSFRESAH